MMRMLGVILVGGVFLGASSTASAQMNVAVGNPWTGTYLNIGTPGLAPGYYYGAYPYGAVPGAYPYGAVPGATFYGRSNVPPGFSTNVPGVTYYGSAYSGYAAPAPVAMPAVPVYDPPLARRYAPAPMVRPVWGGGGWGWGRGWGGLGRWGRFGRF